MTHELYLGNRAYSSWSLRAWLIFDRFGIGHRLHFADFARDEDVAAQIGHPPARTVPTLVTDDGAVIHDSLALAEELATRHPQMRIWPGDPRARATARTLAGEMHSGFAALRSDCPMNLRQAYAGVEPAGAVRDDLARIDAIWTHAFDTFGGDWLCGDWSAADAFFAPVAARIAGYGLRVSDGAAGYVSRHLADPGFRRWRAMALVEGPELPRYAKPCETAPWPGPAPAFTAPAGGPAANDACPFTGGAPAHVLSLDERTLGFATNFDRDKVMADPLVWPEVTVLLDALPPVNLS